MKIDIWSDIRCPFCYIGKRNFEAALAKFPHKEQITGCRTRFREKFGKSNVGF